MAPTRRCKSPTWKRFNLRGKVFPDGTKMAVAGSIGIWLYDAQTGEELELLIGHTVWVWSVAFSPDGNTI